MTAPSHLRSHPQHSSCSNKGVRIPQCPVLKPFLPCPLQAPLGINGKLSIPCPQAKVLPGESIQFLSEPGASTLLSNHPVLRPKGNRSWPPEPAFSSWTDVAGVQTSLEIWESALQSPFLFYLILDGSFWFLLSFCPYMCLRRLFPWDLCVWASRPILYNLPPD